MEDSAGMESNEEARLSRYNRTATRELTETVQQAQGLGSLDQMGSQSSEGKGTQGPIPNQESPPTGDSAQRENCFSSRGLTRHTNHT